MSCNKNNLKIYLAGQNNSLKTSVAQAETSKTRTGDTSKPPAIQSSGKDESSSTTQAQELIETTLSLGEEMPKSEHTLDEIKSEDNKSNIKQPVIKLNRLTEEDQALLQKSLKEFVESKPERAKNLGIEIKDEDNDEDPGNSRRTKRKADNSDDEYQPDMFSALLSANKKRKTNREKTPEPIVVAKPKLRRVEKKFVPVLEKLSTEELMETNTYHRFNKSIEVVLRTAEDIDANEIGMMNCSF